MATIGQNPNYSILLSNEKFTPAENLNRWMAERGREPGEERFIQLIQFYEIPTADERKSLQAAGITLGDYLPHYAYIASFEQNFQREALTNLKIRAILDLDERFKLSPDLYQEKYPDHAISGGLIRLKLLYYPGLQHSAVVVEISPLVNILQENAEESWMEIELPISQISTLHRLQVVKYLEPTVPEPILEETIFNTSGRTNWLNTGIGGVQYDGSGVTLAVEEGGIVSPAEHIEFHGRFTEAGAGSVSGHKTGVAIRIGGAGNRIPKNRSIASGSDILSINNNIDNVANFSAIKLRSVNHSYGYGVGTTGWSVGTIWDGHVRDSVGPTHTWSAGNVGGSTSNYGPYSGITGYANLTGGSKQAKNTFAVGSVNEFDVLTGFSSHGPTYDGRIKPDLVIEGKGGTSHAAPKISGIIGQLIDAYKDLNSGVEPHLSLVKAILLNTCDDLENAGPDYRTGFGRANARRAFLTMYQGQHEQSTITHGSTNAHSISVPAGTRELRVLIHWPDYPASTSIPVKALVNDLDLSLTDPGNTTYLPWILNPFPHLDSLSKSAVRGVDTLNNTEQITLANPVAGNYTLTIDGTMVPQGPQKYYLTYEFLMDEVTLTYPTGREHFVPGEKEHILWDAYGTTGTFDLDYSTDNGSSWMSISTGIPSTIRAIAWTVPDVTSGQVLVRITQGTISDVSNEPFHIMPLPTGLQAYWICSDTIFLEWDPMEGASGYRITQLGTKYMDSIGWTTDPYFMLTGASSIESEWFSIQAYGANDALSRRVVAFEVPPGDLNCFGKDVALEGSIKGGYYPDCFGMLPVRIQVRNVGTNPISNMDVKYSINGGTPFSEVIAGPLNPGQQASIEFANEFALGIETDTITSWVELTGDGNPANDTLVSILTGYASGSVFAPYTQDFDNFTLCSTDWGCEEISCLLEASWYNVPNVPVVNGDGIDWRADANGTGTGSTGPSGDHTSGTGNYLYLEGSGAGGSGCQNKEAVLHSPCIDLCQITQPKLKFWYHMYGGAIGSLHVDILAGGEWIEDVITPKVGEQGNQWKKDSVDLSLFVGKVIVIRFRGTTGNGYTADLAIDDVSISGSPTSNPVAECNDVTIFLGEGLRATLSPNSVYAGSATACSIDTLFLSRDTFYCSDLGENEVSLTLFDLHGNESSCLGTVSVENDPANPPAGTCCLDGDSEEVHIGSIQELSTGFYNPSGDDNGYGNYMSFVMTPSNPYWPYLYMLFSPGGPAFGLQNWELYIDWNQNDQFEPSEKMVDNCTSLPFASFISLAGKPTGLFKMRIVMQRDTDGDGCQPGELPNPLCGSIGEGEVEDYMLCNGCNPAIQISDPSTLEETNQQVQVFPNPVTDRLIVVFSLPVNGAVDWELMDVNGKLVMQQQNIEAPTEIQISTREIPAGLYVLRIRTKDGIISKQIVKQ